MSKRANITSFRGSQGKSLVVLDEAYGEYLDSSEQGIDLLAQFQNLIICRTLSKYYSLAGLRVGFGIAAPGLVEKLIPYQSPYPVPSIVSQWLTENFNQDFITSANNEYKKLKFLKIKLKEILAPFGEVKISKANFVNLYTSNSKIIYEKLKSKKVEVRLFDRPSFLRFSIGTKQEMEQLFAILENIL